MMIYTSIYKDLTLGRLFLSSIMMIGISCGAYFEERELHCLKDFNYKRYEEIIPNKFFPDFSILFKSE